MNNFFSSMPTPLGHPRLPENGMSGNPHRAEFVKVAGGQAVRRCREGRRLAAKERRFGKLKAARSSKGKGHNRLGHSTSILSLGLLRFFAAIPQCSGGSAVVLISRRLGEANIAR